MPPLESMTVILNCRVHGFWLAKAFIGACWMLRPLVERERTGRLMARVLPNLIWIRIKPSKWNRGQWMRPGRFIEWNN